MAAAPASVLRTGPRETACPPAAEGRITVGRSPRYTLQSCLLPPSQHPPRRAQTPPPLTGTPRGYDAKSSAPFSSTVAPARPFSRYRAPGSRHNNPGRGRKARALPRICRRPRSTLRSSNDVFCHGNLPPNPQSTPKPTRNWHDHAYVLPGFNPTLLHASPRQLRVHHPISRTDKLLLPPNRSRSQPSHNHIAKQQVVNQ
jgi:hypothetical protein